MDHMDGTSEWVVQGFRPAFFTAIQCCCSQDQPSLKLMRSLKSMRALRLVRTFRFVRGLRLLVTACKCFIPSLFWSMVPWLALLSLANLGINSSEPQ